eukprot:35672-Chlamydomonas_euryale.AAC.1
MSEADATAGSTCWAAGAGRAAGGGVVRRAPPASTCSAAGARGGAGGGSGSAIPAAAPAAAAAGVWRGAVVAVVAVAEGMSWCSSGTAGWATPVQTSWCCTAHGLPSSSCRCTGARQLPAPGADATSWLLPDVSQLVSAPSPLTAR